MAESVTISRTNTKAEKKKKKENRNQIAWSENLQRLAAIVQDSEMERIVDNKKI